LIQSILVIPDGQVRNGVPIDHWRWLGEYAARKKFSVIVNLGDMADMPSLSSYDKKGGKNFEGRRYTKDVDAVKRALDHFHGPQHKLSGYSPRLEFTLGNHEERIDRAIEADPTINEGTISTKDLSYEAHGWRVHPYLRAVKIGGVYFSHFFPSGTRGLPCSSARKIISTYHTSCIAGHQQGLDFAGPVFKPDGARITAIIAGSFYQHEEKYIPHVRNRHWRGVVVLHEVRNGSFDPMFVSMDYLKRKFK
jgi:hypothetical protein